MPSTSRRTSAAADPTANGQEPDTGRSARSAAARGRTPPVLVQQTRGGVVESQHRGSIVQVGIDGKVLRALGDPNLVTNIRSAVKPFGLVALVEAGGIDAFGLSPQELAVMAASHSGEDLHVRTLQAVYRRAGLSQQSLGCGTDGAPLDPLTATRLARDGERPGPIRHMCSGQHSALLLLCKIHDWPLADYWRPEHPVQRLCSATIARAFGTTVDRLVPSLDACGIPTYAFPLNEIARAYAFFAEPEAVSPRDPRSSIAGPLLQIRDAMLGNPDLVAGTRDRIDTSTMKAAPGRVVSKGGAEGLRAFAVLPGAFGGTRRVAASGVALKIEDGGAAERAPWAAAIETLRQIGVLEPAALRALGRYARPRSLDSHGQVAAEAAPIFELAPVGELVG